MAEPSATPLKPEEGVRQAVIKRLRALGWPEERLQWKPEWQVPDTPHDLTKREREQKYAVCGSADLVAFADNSREWYALQVIFEFKQPTLEEGRSQLIRYLSNEPMAKMGYWTNGSASLAVYKRHSADWVFEEGAGLPHPDDDLTEPPVAPPTWTTLRVPTEAELTGALKRIVATIVVSDPKVNRREDQLRELLHVLLVKLDSDAYFSRSANHDQPVKFRLYGDKVSKIALTAKTIREHFKDYFQNQRTRVFLPHDREELLLSDETIFSVVAELAPFRILGDNIDLLAKAFQIFRKEALKSQEGQYLTPLRIVRPALMAMQITSADKIIDPACGTGAFLVEALRQVSNEFPGEKEAWNIVKWANDNVYGIDKDDIGVKLTKAVMIALRDGSTHTFLGDSIRAHLWEGKYPDLAATFLNREQSRDEGVPVLHEQFTVVVTNPPFGENLKVRAADSRAAGYTIARAAAMGGKEVDLEIGLIFLELAHRLLRVGGRVGIVLPETYFFSYSYRWLPSWLAGRFAIRGMINIPMEAFEEFCRAKTNFYIFEKIGNVEGVLAAQEEAADASDGPVKKGAK